MRKALREIGFRRALKYGLLTLYMGLYKLLLFPPLRVWALRLVGAKIGRDVILHDVHFINYDRRGFPGLTVGDRCFLADHALLDLADEIVIEDHVTLSARSVVMTHLNVGYQDHPLQQRFPSRTGRVVLRRGCFVAASVTILQGVEIGEESFVAAGSLVNNDVPARRLVGGVPARTLQPADE